VKGVIAGAALGAIVVACATVPKTPPPEWEKRMVQLQEIDRLYSEIRVFRSDMKLELEPPVTLQNAFRTKSTKEARAVCPDNHKIPATCDDSCRLSSHICENSELICKIADELGPQDRAQEKCTSAKASCREAKQRCCDCSVKPPVVEPVTP
jgi:hypothetical protein